MFGLVFATLKIKREKPALGQRVTPDCIEIPGPSRDLAKSKGLKTCFLKEERFNDGKNGLEKDV